MRAVWMLFLLPASEHGLLQPVLFDRVIVYADFTSVIYLGAAAVLNGHVTDPSGGLVACYLCIRSGSALGGRSAAFNFSKGIQKGVE